MSNSSDFWDNEITQQTRLNMTELNRKLSAIFSRYNLALPQRTITANTILDYKDSVVLVDTSGGAITITLQYANSWASNKSPLIAIIKTNSTNTLTIAPQAGDTLSNWSTGTLVTGNITASGTTVLMSDGANTWYVLTTLGGSVDPYYARCRLTSAMTTITTETKVTPFSTNLSGFTVSADVLTCQQAGYYRLDMSTIVALANSGEIIYVGYRINGGTTIFPIKYTGNLAAYRVPIATTVGIKLAANDTVEFRVVRASGAGNESLYDDTEFNLTRIAA